MEMIGSWSADGCGCHPGERLYCRWEWNKRPARLFWVCRCCRSIGVTLVAHGGMSGYDRSEPWGDEWFRHPDREAVRYDCEMMAIYAISDGLDHRARSAPIEGCFHFSLAEHSGAMPSAFYTFLDEEREKVQAEANERVAFYSNLAKSDIGRYRYLKDRLIEWHKGRAARLADAPDGRILWADPDEAVIYGLVDPECPAVVRYVGITANPKDRYIAHCDTKEWAGELMEAGRYPTMILIELLPMREDVGAREAHWINHYRRLGMADLNKRTESTRLPAHLRLAEAA